MSGSAASPIWPVRPPARIFGFHPEEAGAAPARVTTVAFLQLARRPGSQPGNAGATPARDAKCFRGVAKRYRVRFGAGKS